VNEASEVVVDLPGAQFRLDSEYRERFAQLWVRACHEADGREMDAGEEATRRPVVTADPTVGNGLVIRWRHSTEDRAVLSASRDGVMIHGGVFINNVIRQWIFDAERACEAIRAGREDDAKAMATHEWDRAFCGDLVPVVREASTP
jgi:hypothetical protein